MTTTLLNVSGKLSRSEVEIFDSICRATSQLGIPFLVIGASARDLMLHHVHGIEVTRATGDIDFAIQVAAWNEFQELKNNLLSMNFTESPQEQRLVSPYGIPVDIVPFGEIEDERAMIRWQPENVVEMNVLGFREAFKHANIVRIREQPKLDISIVTLAGLSILKIISWSDRRVDIRKKDAVDMLHLLKTYERIPAVNAAAFETAGLMEYYDWDTTLAAAHLLGIEASKINSVDTRDHFIRLQKGEIIPQGIEQLVTEMADNDAHHERNRSLLEAYFSGVLQTNK